MSSPSFKSSWIFAFAAVTAASTLVLIGIGGLVTSMGVGMAVPDWPTTYGYNMFFFPFSKWQGGIFHEHSHRLVASAVGLFTLILAIWTQCVERRSWVKIMAWSAFGLVCVQGVLGGKRVVLNDVPVFGIPGAIFFGVLHAITAQVFFSLVSVLALFLSPAWISGWRPKSSAYHRKLITAITSLIFVQLIVAATMRHQHAGLAIPDFPLAYGRVYPPTDAEFLKSLNQRRSNLIDDAPVTAFQIHLQMVHRFMALAIVGGIFSLAFRRDTHDARLVHWIRAWAALAAVQVLLGVATILTNKSADIATFHVVLGALCLVLGVLTAVVVHSSRDPVSRDLFGQVAACGGPTGPVQTSVSSALNPAIKLS